MKLNKRIKNRYLILLYLVFITILSLTPGSPDHKGLPGLDKLVHFLFYLILGHLLIKNLNESKLKSRFLLKFAAAVFISSSYGIIIEILQGFVPYRSPEPLDIVANSAGSFAGALSGLKKGE